MSIRGLHHCMPTNTTITQSHCNPDLTGDSEYATDNATFSQHASPNCCCLIVEKHQQNSCSDRDNFAQAGLLLLAKCNPNKNGVNEAALTRSQKHGTWPVGSIHQLHSCRTAVQCHHAFLEKPVQDQGTAISGLPAKSAATT